MKISRTSINIDNKTYIKNWRSEGFLNGIFDPCTWWSRGLTRYGEFLGRRRRRRRRQLSKCTIHSTQYTIHSTQDTIHNTQYTIHNTQYTIHSTQYTVHSTQYTVHSTQYTIHRLSKWFVFQYFQVQDWIKMTGFPLFPGSNTDDHR